MPTKYWYNLNAMLIGALKLTLSEMIVFRWFVGFVISGKMQHFNNNGREYFLVVLSKAVDDLKFTQLKTKRHYRRIFKSLVAKKVLYFMLENTNRAYYALTENGYDLCAPLLKAKHKQLGPRPDHKDKYQPAGRFTKPDAEMPANILKRIMPRLNPS